MSHHHMRVVAFADSLSMARREGAEVIRWEDTWPFRLRARLVEQGVDAEVINGGARARTASALVGQPFVEHVEWMDPDVVVVQIGIVDCAPRIISLAERRLLNLPIVPRVLRDGLIARRSAHRGEITGRDPLARVYTHPIAYREHFEAFFAKVAAQPRPPRIYVLPILIDTPRADKKSPGYADNVRCYNRVLREVCPANNAELVELPELSAADDPAQFFCEDHYHLSAAGNDLVAQRLAEHLTPDTEGGQ